MTADRSTGATHAHPSADPEIVDTVIIGGGQCGLAVGYYLAKQGQTFVILDEHQRVGDCWRQRYDSLRLYSPARYDTLPGMSFPAPGHSFPSGAQMADYLETYVAEMHLPVRNGVSVSRVRQSPTGGFIVTTNNANYQASHVVVATGGQHLPHVPDFAGGIDPDVRQFHSSDYRNPAQLQDGGVLVVGASHSGADLALESAATHPTWLVGRDTGQIPFNIEGRPARAIFPVLWFAWSHVLTLNTPIGRKMQDEVRSQGGPLLRYRKKDLDAADVKRVEARVSGAKNGKPMLDDGRVLDVANIIWCTGFRRDFSWIELPILDEAAWPKQQRGVVADVPGLYFVGLVFQQSFSSMLVGGAGRDARHVAKHIASTRSTELQEVGSGRHDESTHSGTRQGAVS